MTDDEQAAAYATWLDAAEDGPTPPLAEFRRWMDYDSGNTVWRLRPGHVANLLDQAVDQLDEQTQRAERTQQQMDGLAGEVAELAARVAGIRVVIGTTYFNPAKALSDIRKILNRPFPTKG